MYRTIFVDYQGRLMTDERELAIRVAHLKATRERCARKGVLRRCQPVAAEQPAR